MLFPYTTKLSLSRFPDLHFHMDYTNHIKIYAYYLLKPLINITINLICMYSLPFTKNDDML